MGEPADPLQFVPMEEWEDLEKVFKDDWPRGIAAYNTLRNQRKLFEMGLDYGFRVYRPRGYINSGMVAFNKKGSLNEIILQCPSDDTSRLEEALVNTKLINWQNRTMIPFMPDNIRQCVRKVTEHLQLHLDEDDAPNILRILDAKSPLFPITKMKENIKIKPITEEQDIHVLDSAWRNRFDGSVWLFNILSKANSGYGLYLNDRLVSWVFINEVGALTNLGTLEEHRGKGFAKLLMEHICNVILKENRDVFAYCREGNISACHLYDKLNFKTYHGVLWCFINSS